VLLAKFAKSVFEQWQSVFELSLWARCLCFPRQKISDDVTVFVRGSFCINMRKKYMTRHHETQTTCKGIRKIVGDAVEFVVFHMRISSLKPNGSKVRSADIAAISSRKFLSLKCRLT